MNSEPTPGQSSPTNPGKPLQQEIVIDIHLKSLKMKVSDQTPLRVIWSRGKKQAKSQIKQLN